MGCLEVVHGLVHGLVHDEDRLPLIVKLEDLVVHLVLELVRIVLIGSHSLHLQLEQEIHDLIQQRTFFLVHSEFSIVIHIVFVRFVRDKKRKQKEADIRLGFDYSVTLVSCGYMYLLQSAKDPTETTTASFTV